MNKLFIAAVFVIGCANHVDSVAAGYEIELNTCVEVSHTRDEYESCKRAVQKRYEKEWNNAVD